VHQDSHAFHKALQFAVRANCSALECAPEVGWMLGSGILPSKPTLHPMIRKRSPGPGGSRVSQGSSCPGPGGFSSLLKWHLARELRGSGRPELIPPKSWRLTVACIAPAAAGIVSFTRRPAVSLRLGYDKPLANACVFDRCHCSRAAARAYASCAARGRDI
jgi:hypothetical protein